MEAVFAPEDVRDLETPAPAEYDHHRRLRLTLLLSSPLKLNSTKALIGVSHRSGLCVGETLPDQPQKAGIG